MRYNGGERASRQTYGVHLFLAATSDKGILAKPIGKHRAISLVALPDQGRVAPHTLKAKLSKDLHRGPFPHTIGKKGAGFAGCIDQLPPAVLDF